MLSVNFDLVVVVVKSTRCGFDCSYQCYGHPQEEELKSSMLLVFANKQDIEGAMTPSEISNALGLSALKNRTWAIFKTSATKGEGLEEAMEW